MSERWVLFNHQLMVKQQAKIPIDDRGFLFGEGVFTTIRVNQGKSEFLHEHLQRLKKHMHELDFTWDGLDVNQIDQLIEYNGAYTGIWRLKIIITVQQKGKTKTTGQVIATLDPYLDCIDEPCTLILFPYPIESPLAHIKTLSYLDHLYVRQFAQRQGYDDAITQNHKGFVLETGCSNLFWIDQGKCWVPDPSLPYLRGIVLNALICDLPYPICYIKATLDQISSTAHVYICNALTHVRPVLLINERLFSRSLKDERCLKESLIYSKNLKY